MLQILLQTFVFVYFGDKYANTLFETPCSCNGKNFVLGIQTLMFATRPLIS